MLCAVLGPVQKMNNSYLCNIIQWLIMLEILDNKFENLFQLQLRLCTMLKKNSSSDCLEPIPNGAVDEEVDGCVDGEKEVVGACQTEIPGGSY